MRAPGDRVLNRLKKKNEGLPNPVQGWWWKSIQSVLLSGQGGETH
jgi:hypothetical protein